jgi:hypothetical protein
MPVTPIRGRVRDPQGRPIAQAKVYFTSGPVPLPDIAMLTDSEGAFSISAPAPGTYQLECTADGFAPRGATISMPAEEITPLTIILEFTS